MTLRQQLATVEGRAIVVRWWNVIVSGTATVCLVILIICWAAAISSEGGGTKRRHAGSIIAFLFTIAAIVLNVLALRSEPGRFLLCGVQLVAVLALMLTGVAGGMTAIVVDLCAASEARAEVSCGAHYAEYAATLLVCLCMGSIFVTVQQKLVLLVDRGILSGISSRMARIDA